MRRIVLCALTVALLAACQKQDASAPESADQLQVDDGKKDADKGAASAVTLPDTGLTDIANVDTCLAVFGAVATRQGGDVAEEVNARLGFTLDPKGFNAAEGVFAKKDKAAAMAPQVAQLWAPHKDAKFFTFTVTPDASQNGKTMVNPYNEDGPGFPDMTGYLGNIGGHENLAGYWEEAIDTSSVGFRHSERGASYFCNLKFSFPDLWFNWYLVPDEAQARAVEAARANQTLRVRFDGVIDSAEVTSDIPQVNTSVLRVHLVDEQGNILATPKPGEPRNRQ